MKLSPHPSKIDLTTGTCFIQKLYAPSSSLLQGNIYPFSLPPFASIFFAYLWSFRWPNYIVTKTDQCFIKITSFIKRQMVAINHPKINTTCGAWCHPYTTTIQWNHRNHWTTSVESLLHHYYHWTFTSFCFGQLKLGNIQFEDSCSNQINEHSK